MTDDPIRRAAEAIVWEKTPKPEPLSAAEEEWFRKNVFVGISEQRVRQLLATLDAARAERDAAKDEANCIREANDGLLDAIDAYECENAALRGLLAEARLQLQYLNEKFPATGTTEAVLAKIDSALNKGD